MISAERLRDLLYDALPNVPIHPTFSALIWSEILRDTQQALTELEAARTRIASLEQDVSYRDLRIARLSDEVRTTPERLLGQLRAQGLSQEDREACLTGANFIEFVTAKTEPDSENQRIVIEMDRRKAAILRRLGGQHV